MFCAGKEEGGADACQVQRKQLYETRGLSGFKNLAGVFQLLLQRGLTFFCILRHECRTLTSDLGASLLSRVLFVCYVAPAVPSVCVPGRLWRSSVLLHGQPL